MSSPGSLVVSDLVQDTAASQIASSLPKLNELSVLCISSRLLQEMSKKKDPSMLCRRDGPCGSCADVVAGAKPCAAALPA